MLKLSHSQKELYLRCPMAYYIKYMLRMQEETTSSALIFGTAIDEGVSALLENVAELRAATMSEEQSLGFAIARFQEKWFEPEINKVKVDIETTKLVKYSKKDLDESLFKKGEVATPWESLNRKGQLIIETYSKEIIPKIKRVIAIQKEISLTNDIGDSITGFVDFIAEFYDHGVLLVDNKTASKAYAPDAIQKEGEQLQIYDIAVSEEIKLDGVGFCVMEKDIRKKDPKVRITLLVDKPRQENEEALLQKFSQVALDIKMGRFESKHPECKTFWGICPCQSFNPNDPKGFVHVPRK